MSLGILGRLSGQPLTDVHQSFDELPLRCDPLLTRRCLRVPAFERVPRAEIPFRSRLPVACFECGFGCQRSLIDIL